MTKKKWLPRQQSEKLGRKGHLVILSKKDKANNKRDKGKRRRDYMSDHENQPASFLFLWQHKESWVIAQGSEF